MRAGSASCAPTIHLPNMATRSIGNSLMTTSGREPIVIAAKIRRTPSPYLGGHDSLAITGQSRWSASLSWSEYTMNSSSEPSGSRKYVLLPRPAPPWRTTGPCSTSTPCCERCRVSSFWLPCHTKHRSLPPGRTGRAATSGPKSSPGPCTFNCWSPKRKATSTISAVDNLRRQHVAVERDRPVPVADRNDHMIQTHCHHPIVHPMARKIAWAGEWIATPPRHAPPP